LRERGINGWSGIRISVHANSQHRHHRQIRTRAHVGTNTPPPLQYNSNHHVVLTILENHLFYFIKRLWAKNSSGDTVTRLLNRQSWVPNSAGEKIISSSPKRLYLVSWAHLISIQYGGSEMSSYKGAEREANHFHHLVPRLRLIGAVEASWNVMADVQKPVFVFRRNVRVHWNRRGEGGGFSSVDYWQPRCAHQR